MAEMPRQKARSVLDPIGDRVEAFHRQERLRREQAEDAAALERSQRLAAFQYPFERRSASFDFTSPSEPTVNVGNQRYREVDNGRANVLVPVDDPLVTPAIKAERRRSIDRAFFMANQPFGSVGYMLATAAGASPGVRDAALVAGSVLDAGAAPRNAIGRRPAKAPQRTPAAPPLAQDKLRLRELNSDGQPRGTNAWVMEDMLGPGRRPDRRLEPPGWQGNGRKFKEARGHLHAGSLGGPHDDPRNFVTLTQTPTNSPHMRDFEGEVARRAKAGEVIEYAVTPLYRPGVKAPGMILMTAQGSRGAPMARVVVNPAGRPK